MLSKIKVKKLMQFYLGELHNYHNNHLLLIKILVFKRQKDCACSFQTYSASLAKVLMNVD